MHISFLKKHPCLCVWVLSTLLIFTSSNTYAALNEAKSAFPITLESVVKRTLSNNPQLYQFNFRQQIINGEIKTALLRPGYTVGADVENFLGSGQVSGIKDLELTLTLSSVIELGGKVHQRKKVWGVKYQMLAVAKQMRSLDILVEVMRRYIDVLAQQETVKAVNDEEQLASYTCRAVARRVKAGASPFL